jgi:hypothetical protein
LRRLTAAVLGFVVAPLISALVLSATTRLFEPLDIVARIGMMPVFYYFSAGATILLGLPAFLLFLHFNIIRWWSVLGSGLAIGVLMGLVVGAQNGAQIPDVLLMATAGAASALGFWLIWEQGREGGDGSKRAT